MRRQVGGDPGNGNSIRKLGITVSFLWIILRNTTTVRRSGPSPCPRFRRCARFVMQPRRVRDHPSRYSGTTAAAWGRIAGQSGVGRPGRMRAEIHMGAASETVARRRGAAARNLPPQHRGARHASQARSAPPQSRRPSPRGPRPQRAPVPRTPRQASPPGRAPGDGMRHSPRPVIIPPSTASSRNAAPAPPSARSARAAAPPPPRRDRPGSPHPRARTSTPRDARGGSRSAAPRPGRTSPPAVLPVPLHPAQHRPLRRPPRLHPVEPGPDPLGHRPLGRMGGQHDKLRIGQEERQPRRPLPQHHLHLVRAPSPHLRDASPATAAALAAHVQPQVATASSAPNGRPSWNDASSRRRKTQTRASGLASQPVASSPRIAPSAPISVRQSNTAPWPTIRMIGSKGRRPSKSPIPRPASPSRSDPPRAGSACAGAPDTATTPAAAPRPRSSRLLMPHRILTRGRVPPNRPTLHPPRQSRHTAGADPSSARARR
jgi:hypothetical protein